MDSVVKCGCWIVDPLHFDRFNAAYLEFFRARALPARSPVVSRLCLPCALVEFDAVPEAPVTSYRPLPTKKILLAKSTSIEITTHLEHASTFVLPISSN